MLLSWDFDMGFERACMARARQKERDAQRISDVSAWGTALRKHPAVVETCHVARTSTALILHPVTGRSRARR